MVDLLDRAGSAEAADVNFVVLLNADASTAAQTLATIFSQGSRLGSRLGGTPGNAQPEAGSGRALVSPLNVTADRRMNALILSGRRDSIELAQRLLRDIDKPWDASVTEVKLFRLIHATPSRILPLLEAVFKEGTPVPGAEGLSTFVSRLQTRRDGGKTVSTEQAKVRSALTLQADDASSTLIVAARADSLPLIEEVLKQIDISDASGLSTVRIYPLKHADAASLQKIITDLYSGPRTASARPADRPVITLDDRSNSMIVSGNEKAFAIVDSLLAQLDQPMALELRDIRILPLAHSDAAQLATTLQRLMDQRVTRQGSLGRSQAESLRVLIIPETRSNSLLVGGSKDAFELVESLAAKLDQSAPSLSGGVRIVPLEFADARTLSTSFLPILESMHSSSRPPAMTTKSSITSSKNST